jgi:hypothetical protein
MHNYFVTLQQLKDVEAQMTKSQETGLWKGQREFQHEYTGIYINKYQTSHKGALASGVCHTEYTSW